MTASLYNHNKLDNVYATYLYKNGLQTYSVSQKGQFYPGFNQNLKQNLALKVN